jgi:hypothetical protein
MRSSRETEENHSESVRIANSAQEIWKGYIFEYTAGLIQVYKGEILCEKDSLNRKLNRMRSRKL